MNTDKFETISSKIGQALPAEHGYDKGFKDALESVALALIANIPSNTLDDAIQTALDAHANNYEKSDLIQLSLNVYDDVGNVVDGTVATVSVDQLSDIVDQASQLILVHRDGQPIDNLINDLEEALSSSEVIDPISQSV